MDQEAARARELAEVMVKADRDELARIKAALKAPEPPTQRELAAQWDKMMMERW